MYLPKLYFPCVCLYSICIYSHLLALCLIWHMPFGCLPSKESISLKYGEVPIARPSVETVDTFHVGKDIRTKMEDMSEGLTRLGKCGLEGCDCSHLIQDTENNLGYWFQSVNILPHIETLKYGTAGWCLSRINMLLRKWHHSNGSWPGWPWFDCLRSCFVCVSMSIIRQEADALEKNASTCQLEPLQLPQNLENLQNLLVWQVS